MPNIETDITDDYNMNPITGSERPVEFQIHNGNPLHEALYKIRREIQWLQSEGYKFCAEDCDEASWVMTEIAACMRIGLGELIERVISAYRCAVEDDCAHERSRIPEREVIGNQVRGATWRAASIGLSEDDVIEGVRTIFRSRKAMEDDRQADASIKH
jgi:hypothetical protein